MNADFWKVTLTSHHLPDVEEARFLRRFPYSEDNDLIPGLNKKLYAVSQAMSTGMPVAGDVP